MDEPARVRVIRGGPLVVEGAPLARVVKKDSPADWPPRWTAERIDTGPSYLLCRCGGSTTKPFCDRWPGMVCFQEQEPNGFTPVFTWRPPDDVEGPMVALKPNGPARVSGGAQIEHEDGSAIDEGSASRSVGAVIRRPCRSATARTRRSASVTDDVIPPGVVQALATRPRSSKSFTGTT